MNGFVLFLIALAFLIGGFFFIKNFDRIENSFFGDGGECEASSYIFVLISAAIGAIAAAWAIIGSIADFADPKIVSFAGMCVLLGAIFCALGHIAFHCDSTAQMLGRMLFVAVACIIGAIIGAAGSILVLAALVLMFFLYVLGGALSSSGSSSSGGSSSNNNDNEVRFSVDGELGERTGRDIGGGTILDNCGDVWEKDCFGNLRKKY